MIRILLNRGTNQGLHEKITALLALQPFTTTYPSPNLSPLNNFNSGGFWSQQTRGP